jgi:hypothetical protein
MLNRRTGVLAAFLVAAICGLAAFLATTSGHANDESSATALAGSPVAATSAKADASRMQSEGPEPRAFSRPPQATDTPLAKMPQLAQDVRRIATLRTQGVDHALYVGKDSKKMTCLIIQEGALGRGGGGCNPSSNPFRGSHVMWSSGQYNEDPQKLIVFGVVTEGVSAVTLTFDGGVQTAVPLSEDGGFIYIVAKPVINPSDVPRAIDTFDSKGLIEQTELGITFGA